MVNFDLKNFSLNITVSRAKLEGIAAVLRKYLFYILLIILAWTSLSYFEKFYFNGLGLAYNDARSHLDIGRRVVEGLKPGIAQLGSVWLPLNHVLMIPTIWNDFMWHSGLSGAIQNMISFVGTGFLIYFYLKELKVGYLGRIIGILVFAANLNILYLQSTAMTELLLLFTMTAACYELMLWYKKGNTLNLIRSAFWVMLSTLTRYDGWFLLGWIMGLVAINTLTANLGGGSVKDTLKKFFGSFKGRYFTTEGTLILFLTLAGFGIAGWFAWNQLIFKDALYFMYGPFSAHAQQQQLLSAGNLPTKGNVLLSLQIYLYALMYNSYTYPAILGLIGAVVLWTDRKISGGVRLATTALTAPFFFNILALVLGFSVLFIQGISGNTWFNVRYGIMLMPSIAIFIGYLVERAKDLRWLIIGSLVFVLFFALANQDAVTIDDARVGSSQKNVSEVAGYLNSHAGKTKGFILISAASHDAIIFSSGLPMSRFIHEGTGLYWLDATTMPDRWARWIVMRTYDNSDLTWKAVSKTGALIKYNLVAKYPFADVYEIKPEYLQYLNTEPVLGKQK